MVLGLQGYLVLPLIVRKPVWVCWWRYRYCVTGAGGCRVVVCRACWFGANREIGLMRATEQLSSMEMMAVDRCVGLFLPVSGLELFHYHCYGYLRRRGDLGRIAGRRQLEGIDSGFFWSAMQNAVDWRMDSSTV